MYWVCERCDTAHTQNAASCRNCDHSILAPISADELQQRSHGIGSPEALKLDPTQKVGTPAEPEYETSPDVAPDGSIAGAEDPPGAESSDSLAARIRRILPV